VDVIFDSARALAGDIRSRKISAREVMTAFLAQIARLNPRLNAIVSKLDDEACLELADRADHAVFRKPGARQSSSRSGRTPTP
jgi:amidase